MKERISSLLLTLCMVITLLSTITVPASAQTGTLVILGDSISTGYKLDGYISSPTPEAKDSFVNLLAEQTGLTAVNLAVDGLKSEALLNAVKTILEDKNSVQYKALDSANVISVTIGGNDLLVELYVEVGTALGLDVTSATLKTDVMKTVAAAFTTNDLVTLIKVNSALTALTTKVEPISKAYADNLTQIITALKSVNPTATIVLQTIANPYKGIIGISETVEAGADAFNKIIMDGAASGAYVVADVYKAFNASSATLTNVTNPATYLDPHPNKDGHALIAQTIMQLLNPATEESKPEAPKAYADH